MTLSLGDWIAVASLPLTILGAWKPSLDLWRRMGGWTRQAKIDKRLARLQLLDELHRSVQVAQAFAASRLFDTMALLGMAMVLALIIPSAEHAWQLAVLGIAGIGSVIYAMSLNHSVIMSDLRTYAASRERLCRELVSLGYTGDLSPSDDAQSRP